MLKQFVITVLLLLFLIVFGTNSVDAQSAYRFKIDVPFPFVLRGQTFPADTYVYRPNRSCQAKYRDTKKGGRPQRLHFVFAPSKLTAVTPAS